MADEGASNSPPSYDESTGVGGKGKTDDDMTQKLSMVGDQAPKLVGVVNDSMQGVADSLEKLRKNTAKSNKACRPSVSMRLHELETFLIEVIRKGRSYCAACKDLGEYASDDEVIGEIYTDLDLSQLGELNDFLEEIDDYLQICETRFKRVTTAGAEAKKEARQAGSEFEGKMDKARDRQRRERIAAGVIGAVGGGLTAGGAILTFFNPPAGIALMMAGVATGSAAVGLTVDAGFSQAQIDIFSDACEYIIKLDANLETAMNTAKDMRQEIDDIKESGKGIDKLKKKAKQANKGEIAVKRLKYPLKGLKGKMGELCTRSTKLIDKLEKL